jgi:hypothetical protein
VDQPVLAQQDDELAQIGDGLRHGTTSSTQGEDEAATPVTATLQRV